MSEPITDWELGNEILHNVIDAMGALAHECRTSHPEVAKELRQKIQELLPIYRELTGDQALR